MALDLATRRKAASLLAAGRVRQASDVYRRAMRQGMEFADAELERQLLAFFRESD